MAVLHLGRVAAFDSATARAAILSGANGVTVSLGDRAGVVAAAVWIAGDRAGLKAMGVAARRTEGWRERVLVGVEDRLLELVRRRGVGGTHETVAGAAE